MERLSYKEAYPKNREDMVDTKLDREHSPFKALAHPKIIENFVKGEKINPIHIRIGLTNTCNLRCVFCNFHSENEQDFYDAFNYGDYIETDKIIKFLKEFKECGGKAITFCGSGECTIHPGYIKICEEAHKDGLKIGLITNGVMLNDLKIRQCIINTHTWVRIGLNSG